MSRSGTHRRSEHSGDSPLPLPWSQGFPRSTSVSHPEDGSRGAHLGWHGRLGPRSPPGGPPGQPPMPRHRPAGGHVSRPLHRLPSAGRRAGTRPPCSSAERTNDKRANERESRGPRSSVAAPRLSFGGPRPPFPTGRAAGARLASSPHGRGCSSRSAAPAGGLSPRGAGSGGGLTSSTRLPQPSALHSISCSALQLRTSAAQGRNPEMGTWGLAPDQHLPPSLLPSFLSSSLPPQSAARGPGACPAVRAALSPDTEAMNASETGEAAGRGLDT